MKVIDLNEIPEPEEKVEPFGRVEPAISKVLDLNDARTFQVSAILYYRRSPLVALPVDDFGVINPVPVFSEDETRLIGHATIQVDNDCVKATLYLDRACPERLEIETLSRKLYPVTWFKATEIGKDGIKKAVLEKLEVSTKAPEGLGIPALGEPTL